MKSILAAAAALLISTALASAQQHVEWSGSLCITATTPACAASGWSVGQCFATRYVTPNVSDRGSATTLSIFARTYAVNLTAAGSVVGTTFQPVTFTKVGSAGYQFQGSMRVTVEKPTPVIATTPFIRTTGDINNWDDTADCNISFLAAHTRCPQTYC